MWPSPFSLPQKAAHKQSGVWRLSDDRNRRNALPERTTHQSRCNRRLHTWRLTNLYYFCLWLSFVLKSNNRCLFLAVILLLSWQCCLAHSQRMIFMVDAENLFNENVNIYLTCYIMHCGAKFYWGGLNLNMVLYVDNSIPSVSSNHMCFLNIYEIQNIKTLIIR